MLRHYQMFADYNRWANSRIYAACAALTNTELRADKGAFFGSAHRTLNHLLAADRIWMKRLSGGGDAPTTLDAILFDDFDALAAARVVEDQRIIAWVDTLTPETLASEISYTPVTIPTPITQGLSPLLAHIFNHQTHHRGQVHTILTTLGQPSVVLDLVYFLREDGHRWR